MKNQVKKIAIFAVLGIFMWLSSCQTEDAFTQTEQTSNSKFKIEKKTLEELLNDKKFRKAFDKLPKQKINSSNSILAKTVMEQEYGFTISEEIPASVMSDDNITSYTFHITRDSIHTDFFENLVVQVDSLEATTAKIVKYNLNSPIIASTEHNSHNLDISSVEIEEITYNSTQVNARIWTSDLGNGCVRVFVEFCNWGGHTHIAGDNCTESYMWTEVFTVCGGSGGGGGSSSGGSGTGSGGTSGGGGSSSGGGTTVITTPVISYEDGTDAQADFIVSLFNNNNLTLTSQQITWLNKNNSSLPDVIIFLNQNNYSIESLQFLQEIINFDISEGGLKQKMKQAVANGITTTAEYAHKIFKKFSQFAEQNPSIIPVLNSILEGISNTVSPLVNTSPSTCTFTDLFNMWIFELGPNPISINGTTTSTNQLKNQEGVNQARSIAINQIQNGNLQTVNHQWVYGQTQFYDGMVGGNFVTSFLGTYSMTVSISTTQSGYQLNFHVWNTSSWTSATRLRIDNDGDGAHDGIFPNTSRTNEDDLSLGGNFTQHWYWSEPVN